MDTHHALDNMLKQQLRTNGVIDPNVLALYRRFPRERFVPVEYRDFAYADLALPIANDQVMLSPMIEGKLLTALALQSSDRVLEIGTGVGYLSALIASQVKSLTTIEIFPDLSVQAQKNIASFDLENIHFHVGNGLNGWGEGFYDVIVLGGSVESCPPSLWDQLAVNGRLFAVIGRQQSMQATLFLKQQGRNEILFETVLPPLLEQPQRDTFIF